MKNDALKKHHFWLLLGFVPLFTLIGVLVVDSSVGGAITKRKQEIDAASSDIGKKQNPKPKSCSPRWTASRLTCGRTTGSGRSTSTPGRATPRCSRRSSSGT